MMGQTWVEYLANKIPSGPKCTGCEYRNLKDDWCTLFDDACKNGVKSDFCKYNKFLETGRKE